MPPMSPLARGASPGHGLRAVKQVHQLTFAPARCVAISGENPQPGSGGGRRGARYNRRVMGELVMVYGPAGSGKTGRLVEHAARRYRDDRFASTLVLVPTARHGDQFRRRLVARSGVALNLDVSTLAQYARLQAAGRTLSRDVAADLLRRVSLERIAAGGAGRFEPIAEKPGLHALIAEAVAELVAADIEPAAFVSAASKSGSADLGALGDIYDAYRRALADRGWRDPGEAPSLAAETIEAGPAPPGLVLVDSFEFLNPRWAIPKR